MCKCLGGHSCPSSTFSVAIMNGTCDSGEKFWKRSAVKLTSYIGRKRELSIIILRNLLARRGRKEKALKLIKLSCQDFGRNEWMVVPRDLNKKVGNKVTERVSVSMSTRKK